MNEKEDEVEWITVNGVHIPIKPGEDKDTQVKSFLDNRKKQQDLSKAKWKADLVSGKDKIDNTPKGVSYGDGYYDRDVPEKPLSGKDIFIKNIDSDPDFINLKIAKDDGLRYGNPDNTKKRVIGLADVLFKDMPGKKKVALAKLGY